MKTVKELVTEAWEAVADVHVNDYGFNAFQLVLAHLLEERSKEISRQFIKPAEQH